jgi:metallo-beta-lactamase class B
MVRFVIAPSGRVSSTELLSSSMVADKDHAVANCILLAMKGWEFPKPLGDGPVIVSYPFVLTPAPKAIATGPTKKDPLSVGAIDGRVYLYRATNGDGIPANGLVVDTDGGLLLIDAVWSDAQTEAILKWGESTLKRPWIGAVITHDHPDRDGGIGALLRRRIPVGALDLTAARLAQRGVTAGVSVLLKAADASRVDARGFELFFPGPAHTRDNLVVWFPGPRILFGGCLIKDHDAADLGFTADADTAAWPASLRRLSARYPNPSITVPGHGEPLSHGDPYAHTLELLARH